MYISSKGEQPSYAPPPGPPPSYYQQQQYQQQQQQQHPNAIPTQHAHNSYYASFGHLYGSQPQHNQTPGFRHSYGGSPSPNQQVNYNHQPGPNPQTGHGPQASLSPHSSHSAHFNHTQHQLSHSSHSIQSSRPAQGLTPHANQYRPSSAFSYGSFGGGTGTGFAGLPPRIEVWCAQHGGSMSSYHMEIGAQPFGEVFYACKMESGKTKFKRGIYTSNAPAVVEAREKNFLSSKSILRVSGFETPFDGGTNFHSGAKGTFNAPLNGGTEIWEWRRKKTGGGFMDKLARAAVSRMGDWELCRAGSSQAIATWTTGESDGRMKNKHMGALEFHGQAAMGDMGDTFHSLAILAMLRIVHLRYQSELASAAGNSVGSAA